MFVENLIGKISSSPKSENEIFNMEPIAGLNLAIYSSSIIESSGCVFFIAKENFNKYLYITSFNQNKLCEKFNGDEVTKDISGNYFCLKRCPMNTYNRKEIQEVFEFTRQQPIGLVNSFGFGDRLGFANAGHLKSLAGYNFMPILAQQSIRELTRTNRTPEDVLDASVWAVFQEGYKNGFGADADHLKTFADVDLMVNAGFITFTIDPSDYIVNEVESLDKIILKKRVIDLPWKDFNDTSANLIKRYENERFDISSGFYIEPSIDEILEASLKYCRALIHIKNISEYIASTYPKFTYEIEVSIDETDTVTTAFEHFFIVNELNRLKVKFVSLAPRFIGDFEKGIDYKGDIELFKKEYLKHSAIASHFGFYKLSFHSGSDKFTVYKAVADLKGCLIHIKTAGTSYLEALKVVAMKDPDLFREILDYAVGLYENEKKTYHVSADMNKIKSGKDYKDEELRKLFESNDVRQALHVTYGRVLTEKNDMSEFAFKNRINDCLIKNEDLHYQLLIKHFQRHMNPFKNKI